MIFSHKVIMQDGYFEFVKAKNEDIARIQCLHLVALHGKVAEVLTLDPEPVPVKKVRKQKVKPAVKTYTAVDVDAAAKAHQIFTYFGKDKAIILCVEMIAEVSLFGTFTRVTFWNNVMAEVKKFSK